MNIQLPNKSDKRHPTIPGRVSVIMPCYNGEVYVAEAIESVLQQTYPDVELIVIDDGSTDQSVKIIRGYGDALQLLTQENQGPSAARNKGIWKATGEFIVFLDADDYWELNFIESMVSSMKDSDAVLSYCGWQNVGLNGKSSPPFIPPDYENETKSIALLKNASLWPIHVVIIRRDALLDIGAFDVELLACEDYDLWLRLTFTKPIIRVEKVLAYYRHHKPLADTEKRASDAEYIRHIKKVFIEANPELVNNLSKKVLSDCVDGGFLRRGYQCYRKRELVSARRIFRTAFAERIFSFKDLKYVLPALLPEKIYFTLMN